MVNLGSIMFFRWEKYRFVLVMISFSAFHFCTIIAVIVSLRPSRTYTIYGAIIEKTGPFSEPALDA